MKRRVLVATGLAACLLVEVSPALAGLAGSAHDFSQKGWSGGSLCVPCHASHSANPDITAAPLWTHKVTTAQHTVYASPTLNASPTQPGGASKLCLSCHDGTVAIDSFGENTGSETITGTANVGIDLTGNHPISFVYDAALAVADGELHDPDQTSSNLGGTVSNDLLRDGKMECSSCHDVHNTQNNEQLLWLSNDGTLCLTCHIK